MKESSGDVGLLGRLVASVPAALRRDLRIRTGHLSGARVSGPSAASWPPPAARRAR
jgi:hypothetical protein